MTSRPIPFAVAQVSHPFRWSPRCLLRNPADKTNALQTRPYVRDAGRGLIEDHAENRSNSTSCTLI
jgi:hypothetical protein